MKTFMPKASDIERKWYVIDAEGQVMGRLASQVANILRGKNKPIYTPNVDTPGVPYLPKLSRSMSCHGRTALSSGAPEIM